MSLIPCPECGETVSDRARACPHCGFPVAEEMKQTIADLTGESPVESVRGKAAATRLSKWAQHYIELTQEEGKHRRRSSSDESFFDRYQNVVIFVIVIAILILQLAVFFSAVYGAG